MNKAVFHFVMLRTEKGRDLALPARIAFQQEASTLKIYHLP
jgi:hypothetical protein